MTDRFAGIAAGPVPTGRLEPDAIGAAQDTVIGMANAAPAVSVGLTLAALAAATAYAGGPVIVVTALPMLGIANAYRRLTMWNANCGASFEWVGRAGAADRVDPVRCRRLVQPLVAGAARRRRSVSRFVTTGCDAARLLRVWTM